MVCVIFIYNWINDKLSYDDHIKDHERIYHVVDEAGTGDERWHQAVTSLPLAL